MSELVLHKLVPLFALGLNLLLLGSTLVLDRKSQRDWVFAYLVIALAVWNLGVFGLRWTDDPATALAWERFLHLGVILIPALFYHYVVAFLDLPRRHPPLILGYLLCGFFVAVSPTNAFMPDVTETSWGFAPVAGPLYGPFFLYFQAYLVAGLVWLVRAYRALKSSFRRNRTLLVIVGVVVSVLGGLVDFIRFLFGWDWMYPVGIPANTLFCLALGVAIVRYRLMDLGIAAKRLVLYLLTSVTLAPVLLLGLYVLDRVTPSMQTDIEMRYPMILLLGLTAALPLVRKLEGGLDRLLFQRQHAVRDALIALSKEMTSMLEIRKLGQTLTESLVARIPVLHASFFFYDPETENFVPFSQTLSKALDLPSANIRVDRRFALSLRLLRKTIVVGETAFQAVADAQTRAIVSELETDRVALLVPLFLDGELLGVLVLGEKLSGELFDAGEIELLETLMGTTTIALKNSRLYEEARSSREFLRSIAENSADAIVTADGLGRITYFSTGAEQIFGHRAEEVLGQPVADYYHSGLEEARAVMQRLRAEGQVRNYETAFRAKDGRWVEVNTSVSLLRDASGATVGTLGVMKDVTDRKQVEEELQRQREARIQSEKLAAMGSLLAGVAHELNNPLQVILGHAALLGRKAGNGSLAQLEEKIAQATQRCARIVKNFLALARQHPLERQQVALNQVVEEAVELLAYQLRVDDVKVTLNLARDLPVLWADPHQLHQVAVNLVSNAHQAMRQSPTPRRLTLTTRFDPVQRQVSLEVADTGPGIPPELRSRVFDPFFTTKPPGQGTGLGLSLCQGLVESHGGSIRLANRPQRGAVFLIELPAVAPPVAEPKGEPAGASLPPEGKTILVVDDELELANVLAAMLSTDGHQVETATDGIMALERLRERTYDVILSDIRMPKLDGPGFYRELKRSHPGLRQRVIFMTGDELGPETVEFLKRMRVPRLGKPFGREEVRQAIERVLQPRERTGGPDPA
ncbi:MAG: PAS domain S-box protein [Candidatus Methylomirabilia bacterium]